MLVETGREADRIGKIEPERPHRETRIVGPRRRQRNGLQGLDDKRMGRFGIKGPQQRPGQPVEKTNHERPGMKVARTLSAGFALFKMRTGHLDLRAIIPTSGSKSQFEEPAMPAAQLT